MRQALHIFGKDARYLRWEIGVTVVMAAVFPVLWPVVAALLIARSIHAEAIPGDDQFWITRPYSRRSLLAAKMLFIVAFVNTPIFLAQLYQVARAGFPMDSTWAGLLWSQALIVLCLSLPIAAMAAITPSLVSFLFLELALFVVVFGLGQYSFFSSEMLRLRPPWPVGVEWISDTLLVGAAAVGAVVVLLLQFLGSRTRASRLTTAGVVLAGVSVFIFLPPKFALEAETHLVRVSPEWAGVRIASDPNSVGISGLAEREKQPRQPVEIAFVLSGVPEGVEAKVDAFTGSLRGASGATQELYSNGAEGRAAGGGSIRFRTQVGVSRSFFEAERGHKVRLRASVYFSLFGNARSQTIPRQAEPLTVLDDFRCYTGNFERLSQFHCTTAFRWPGKMMSAHTEEGEGDSFSDMVSYSPIPATLRLTPFETHSALGSHGFAPPSPLGKKGPPESVTITVKEPLGHLRRDFEMLDAEFGLELGHAPPPPPPPPPPAARANVKGR